MYIAIAWVVVVFYLPKIDTVSTASALIFCLRDGRRMKVVNTMVADIMIDVYRLASLENAFQSDKTPNPPITDSSTNKPYRLNLERERGFLNSILRSIKAESRASSAMRATTKPAIIKDSPTSTLVQLPAVACAALAGPLQRASQLTAKI